MSGASPLRLSSQSSASARSNFSVRDGSVGGLTGRAMGSDLTPSLPAHPTVSAARLFGRPLKKAAHARPCGSHASTAAKRHRWQCDSHANVGSQRSDAKNRGRSGLCPAIAPCPTNCSAVILCGEEAGRLECRGLCGWRSTRTPLHWRGRCLHLLDGSWIRLSCLDHRCDTAVTLFDRELRRL